jgi:SiaC family regulatory phosphoprotein
MEILNLEGAEDTPKIILDKKNGIFEISGRSLPEDSAEFYRPVLEWIETYAAEANPSTEFTFKLEYFNTASSKLILDVLSALEEIKGIKILWYFHEDDEDMEEAGEEFSELVEIPFEFKTY